MQWISPRPITAILGTDWITDSDRRPTARYYTCAFSPRYKKKKRDSKLWNRNLLCSAKLRFNIPSRKYDCTGCRRFTKVTVSIQHTHCRSAQNLGMRKVSKEVRFMFSYLWSPTIFIDHTLLNFLLDRTEWKYSADSNPSDVVLWNLVGRCSSATNESRFRWSPIEPLAVGWCQHLSNQQSALLSTLGIHHNALWR